MHQLFVGYGDRAIVVGGRSAGAVFEPAASVDASRHRYALWRSFSEATLFAAARWCNFICLNPSTATHEVSDPSVTRMRGFAESFGCHGLIVTNIHSLRSTDPKGLYADDRSDGDPMNWAIISHVATRAHLVIAGWGTHGALRGRGRQVARWLLDSGVELKCLGKTKEGFPRHPLYLKASEWPRPLEAA